MSISAIKSFLRTWRSQLGIQVGTLSVLIATFTIMSLSIVLQRNLKSLLTKWGHEVQLSVYLKDESTLDDQTKIRALLEGSKLFSKIDFLSKDDAASLFKEKMGRLSPSLVSDKNFINPLPASFEAELVSAIRDSSEYNSFIELTKNALKYTGVEEVSYGQGWIENYAAALNVFSMASHAFILVLLAGGLFVVGNAIRSSISQRKDEIAIMELFGATRFMIQWPYIFEGAVMGFVSSAFSIVVAYGFYRWASHVWIHQLQFWSDTTSFQFLSISNGLLIILTGLVLGSVGAFFCVHRLNSGWAAVENGMK